jgi:hypothetical protein
MRFILLGFILGLSHIGIGQAELPLLRKIFFELPQKTDEFIRITQSIRTSDNHVRCYQGAAIAMSAQKKDWPQDKLDAFTQGRDLIEECVAKDLWNAELRFIRLTIQCQSPWFLGYHDNIESDCQVIADHSSLKYINSKDEYWQNVYTFILNQKNISEKQKNLIKPFRQ